MRLKSVYISKYKNLKDFRIDFKNDSFIDIFIGKNGSGKSNFFEALVDIFNHLFEQEEPSFEYSIKYELNGKTIDISYQSNEFQINGKARQKINHTSLPDNVLIYYSGQNETISKLVKRYEDVFKKHVKSADLKDSRSLIGIGSEYKELLLASLLIQPEKNKARQFICKKLGIKAVSDEIKLELERPFYANDKKFNIEDPIVDKYWKAEGIVKSFFEKLDQCASPSEKVREEGYIRGDDKYTLYYRIPKLQTVFKETTPQDLFRQFDNLKTIDMLSRISIPVTLEDGTNADISFFSDGQFQSVYIYSIVELFKDRNCLTFLDEPDSFLHPDWQYEFLKQIIEITSNKGSNLTNNHILMTSHSAVTLIPHEKRKIRFFEIRDNDIFCTTRTKRKAIEELSGKLIKFSEQQQLLSIINSIQIEKKPILFTEGSTDPLIIKEAWYRLFEEDIPFIPIYAFGYKYLKQLLVDVQIHKEMEGLPLFGLFDFDDAYHQWKGLPGNEVVSDPFEGLVRDLGGGNSYAIMLPVSSNADIQQQVINPKTQKIYDKEFLCEIEHLFYGNAITKQYFKKELCPGGSKIYFQGNKVLFAKEVVPTLESSCFDVFRPMFEFIKSRC